MAIVILIVYVPSWEKRDSVFRIQHLGDQFKNKKAMAIVIQTKALKDEYFFDLCILLAPPL